MPFARRLFLGFPPYGLPVAADALPLCDRGEVDIMQPSEGCVASSILAGRAKPFSFMALQLM
jgi:hypothetical protein